MRGKRKERKRERGRIGEEEGEREKTTAGVSGRRLSSYRYR